VLLRHGADASAVSTDFGIDNPDMWGLPPPDLLVLPFIDWKLLPDGGVVPELDPAEFDKFALVLLSSGAAIKHSAMRVLASTCAVLELCASTLRDRSSSFARETGLQQCMLQQAGVTVIVVLPVVLVAAVVTA
jgi:hypothetical protein